MSSTPIVLTKIKHSIFQEMLDRNLTSTKNFSHKKIINKMTATRKFTETWMAFNGGKPYNIEERNKILELAGLESTFEELKEVSIKMDSNHYLKLEELAKKENTSVENLARKIMNDFLNS